MLLHEHNGTSFNSPTHYVNNALSRESGAIPEDERKASEALTMLRLSIGVEHVDDLITDLEQAFAAGSAAGETIEARGAAE